MKTSMLSFLKLNIKWLAAGIIFLVLGYIILAWSPSGNNKSYIDTVFAWNKMTLAPIIILIGYVMIGLSIMRPSKK
jgi:hypothetical protein